MKNPTDKWTRIGEWWIDDSGTALYADGDVGDMGHEAYVIDTLTRRLLSTMDIDTMDEHVGWISDKENEKLIKAQMKEEEFEGDIEQFIEEAAKRIWKDKAQREDALAICGDSGDARKYGMQYDGWIRVAGHGFECWELTKDVLKRMGDGIYDAGHEDVDDEEIFEIYVHKTQMHYTDVPWRVINDGDPGALRVYGTKNNPPIKTFRVIIAGPDGKLYPNKLIDARNLTEAKQNAKDLLLLLPKGWSIAEVKLAFQINPPVKNIVMKKKKRKITFRHGNNIFTLYCLLDKAQYVRGIELTWFLMYKNEEIGNGRLLPRRRGTKKFWRVTGAFIDAKWRGRSLYPKIIKILRNYYGPIRSDQEMTTAAVLSWEKVKGAVLGDDNTWHLNPKRRRRK